MSGSFATELARRMAGTAVDDAGGGVVSADGAVAGGGGNAAAAVGLDALPSGLCVT